jgi:hypothetical protein
LLLTTFEVVLAMAMHSLLDNGVLLKCRWIATFTAHLQVEHDVATVLMHG